MTTFHFELVAPEKLLFTGEVNSVVLAGTEGEMTVLAHQAPSMTTLKPGIVTITDAAGSVQKLFVRGGFADISPTGLNILAETAIPLADLNASVIDAQIQHAQEDLKDAQVAETRRLASEKLAQLQELKAALGH
ncbi:MAG: F0F1 ATP synthase subunit epsilon [Hyphomicrobiales bacterium]|nr:F0F1 ATP synthase subunit epsilon [Hyphomicrobiales bacterium]MDE2113614.1 F0F1 ATP synthase subunit epsilon [Hyphomicrobiales bacterium]